MSVQTRGFDRAASMPVGAVIERVYFADPGDSSSLFDSYADALTATIARHEDAETRHRDFHERTRSMGIYLPLPERLWIDCRWKMTYPAGGGLDTVASRTAYDTLAEAREHLERIGRYAEHRPRSAR